MFNIEYQTSSQTVYLSGHFDNTKAVHVKDVLAQIDKTFTIDMTHLDFICSAGIGVLVMTYSRLKEKDENIYLINLNDHIRKVFNLSHLDTVFDIK